MTMLLRCALVLGVVGCASTAQTYAPFRRAPPSPGDRTEIDSVIERETTVNGEHYTEYRSALRRNELLSMRGDRVTKLGVELARQIKLVNGESSESVLGRFVVEDRDGTLIVTKADGTSPSDRERELLTRISQQSFGPITDRVSLMTFVRGARVSLAPAEAARFGISTTGHVDMTLREVRQNAFVIQLAADLPAGEQLGWRLSGTIEVTRARDREEHWHLSYEYFDAFSHVGHGTERLDYRLTRAK
jgi:hypothetical protein